MSLLKSAAFLCILTASSWLHSQTGYIMGYNGTLFRPRNGGINWNNVPSGTTNTLWNSFFINKQTAWIAGGTYSFNGILLKTIDEGVTWSAKYTGTSGWLTGIYFLNPQTGFAIGSSGVVLKTVNAGENWSPLDIGAGITLLEQVNFFDANTGWITGWDGKLYRTVNAGINWTPVNSGTTSNLYTTYFQPSGTGWISGYAGVLLKTTNSGTNWVSQPVVFNTEFFSIFFAGELGWLCGNSGKMFHSTNGGVNWTPQVVSTNKRLETIDFINSTTGWVVGGYDGSVVFKTIDGGANWVQQSLNTTQHLFSINFWKDPIGIRPISEIVPESYNLYQNYPNPFNPVTKIHFDVPHSNNSNVVLLIYNELGAEIETLLNQKLSPGTYEAEWDASNYSSGVYFCRLISGDYVKTQKMILSK